MRNVQAPDCGKECTVRRFRRHRNSRHEWLLAHNGNERGQSRCGWPGIRLEQVAQNLERGYIINGGYTLTKGNTTLTPGKADVVAFGVPFIANPDLVERFAQGESLYATDQTPFYSGGEKGYTDYPVH